MRSGSPMFQASTFVKSSDVGMSAGLPCGAPLSTQVAIIAISSRLSDGSSLKCWMPRSRSTNQGGMDPRAFARPVRALIDRAHGRTSA